MKLGEAGRERIRQASAIEEVVKESGIALRRVGRGLMGLCPFHADKKPSLSVQVKEGHFHCFGCGEGGDVFRFVQAKEGVGFVTAARRLASRAGLSYAELCEDGATRVARAPRPARAPKAAPAPTRPPTVAAEPATVDDEAKPDASARAAALTRVVDHYHRAFWQRREAQEYLKGRGLRDLDLLRALKVGYADGSLSRLVPRKGELREALTSLGVLTAEGRELCGGCIVVPLPDPLTGQWVNLYGRGVAAPRHCYLPGALRGVLNFQAARTSDEVVLAESVLDAMSFHQAGIATAIPLYGANGFTPDLFDLLLRERVARVILALDNDEAGRKATAALKEKLVGAGLGVRVASWPAGVKDANELLVSRNGDAGAAFRLLLAGAEPASRPAGVVVPADRDLAAETEAAVESLAEQAAAVEPAAPAPPAPPPPVASSCLRQVERDGDQVTLTRGSLSFQARVYPALLGRLRVTVRACRGNAFHLDTLDLLLSKSRTDFARKTAKALGLPVQEAEGIEADLLAVLLEAEKVEREALQERPGEPPALSDLERAEAVAFLRRPDLLDQVVRDAWSLGFVGEAGNVKLLFLVALSRRSPVPLSAVILSQSGAGKSVITEIVEQLTPPEDVVLFTRLTPQSLYYTEPGFLDRKLVIIEERHGSQEADYSVRVLQSRGKLIAAAPVKDPQTGNLRTRVFEVVAKAAFVEATTAGEVNHENATRCFELAMDESVEQTRAIHERQRFSKTEAGLLQRGQAEGIQRRHWNAQRLLEPLPVVIPFADAIEFPATWMRTRRDHARFLNLIEVSAFVHQAQRERKSGAVVASLGDYAVAYELSKEVLAETLSDVKKPLRDAFESIRELAEKRGGTVSRRDVREELNRPDSTVRGWLGQLVELEYLEAEGSKGGAGKTTRYRLTSRGPQKDVALGLLTPAQLEARLAGGRP